MGKLAAMRTGRWLVEFALATVVIGLAASDRAHADPKIDKADQLFAEAKALLGSNLLQACAKFDESLHYNPAAIGTLLNVALCDEKLGRIASAVAKFSEARDRAKEQGLLQHVRAAEQHIAALEPDVPHLAIKLTETLRETTIVLDRRVVALDMLTNIAIDPGEREIVVSAPGRLAYRTKFVIARAEHKDVVIPALARSITITNLRRRIGQIVTITGGSALVTAVGLGLYARNLHHKQFDDECQHTALGDMCSTKGQTQVDRARRLGNIGTIVGAAGAAVAGVGLYLWLRTPTSPPAEASDKKLTIVPQLGADSLGIAAIGRF